MIFLISIVNYIVIYDSCGAAADAVHPSNPLHLIVCFGSLVHALTLCRLFYEPKKISSIRKGGVFTTRTRFGVLGSVITSLPFSRR